MQDIKKIDVHAHVTPYPEFAPLQFTGERFISAPELIKKYDQLNIEKGVLLPIVSSEYQPEIFTSSDCAHVASEYPDRFLWFCGIDPRAYGNTASADLSVLINHYKNLGAKGIGETTCQLYFDDPYLDNLLYHATLCNMPVTIHLAPRVGGYYGIVDDLGLTRLEKMLKKHKKLKILGHSTMFWSHISGDVSHENIHAYGVGKVKEGRLAELLRDYEGLYCDMSAGSGMNAFMRDEEYATRFLDEFADKLLYGCDICLNSQNFALDFDKFLDKLVLENKLSLQNYKKIVRENAIKVLKLDK